MKKALITGIFGQDGSFLYELLAKMGYQVYGIVKKDLSRNSRKIKQELQNKGKSPIVYEIDLQVYEEIKKVLWEIQPDEVYHLAACHVSSEGRRNGTAVDDNLLFKWNVSATANLLAACNEVAQNAKILTAGSCLMFDSSHTCFQDESTQYNSNSLYGIGKITENNLVKYYREKGGYVCTAILYNHESYRRSEDFVTKKIVKNMCLLKKNNNHRFVLGNLEAKKDWGYAGDYVKGMYLMLQGITPQDYILATGELHSIKQFIEICAEILQIDDWQKCVTLDREITNRNCNTQLCGNAGKIEKDLGWKVEKDFKNWVSEMIMYEMR